MKNKGWIKLASIYIGTVIGAGFASGQEIMQFFGVFGYKGIFGVIVASILFSILGMLVLSKVFRSKIESYNQFVTPIFGSKLGGIIDIIITSFLFIGYCVMLAGSGAVFSQQFNINYDIGIYVMTIATLLTFIFKVKGVSIVNSILVPLMILGIVFIGCLVILREGTVFSNLHGAEITKTGNWITSSLLYVSYNSIPAIVIMTTLLPIISNEKDAIKGGLIGGLGLGVLAVFIVLPCLILYTDIYNLDIPMLRVVGRLGNKVKMLYSGILLCAMFTTAIANGFGFIRRISSFLRINQIIISIVFCLITIPLARVGFSQLVSAFYPLFGYLGLFMMIIIIINNLLRRLRIGIK